MFRLLLSSLPFPLKHGSARLSLRSPEPHVPPSIVGCGVLRGPPFPVHSLFLVLFLLLIVYSVVQASYIVQRKYSRFEIGTVHTHTWTPLLELSTVNIADKDGCFADIFMVLARTLFVSSFLPTLHT